MPRKSQQYLPQAADSQSKPVEFQRCEIRHQVSFFVFEVNGRPPVG